MKMFKSTTEGAWTASDATLVPQELASQRMNFELPPEEMRAVLAEIKAISSVEVFAEEASALNAIYESIKPGLKEGDVYAIIQMDAQHFNGSYTGILNCRVNEGHVQVRF